MGGRLDVGRWLVILGLLALGGCGASTRGAGTRVNDVERFRTSYDDEQKQFMRGFMLGEYDLVGRKPDSRETYSGRVTLAIEKGSLTIVRRIGKTIEKGTANFDVAGDDAEVLRMHFKIDGREMEGTYLWGSDLDNYPRMTGYVYRIDDTTKSPGLEVMFPVHE